MISKERKPDAKLSHAIKNPKILSDEEFEDVSRKLALIVGDKLKGWRLEEGAHEELL